MAEPKYRPSLTLAQMQCIVDHLSVDAPLRSSIVKILRPFIVKANEGLVQPAFITREKQSLESSLGLSPSSQSNDAGDAAQLWDMYKRGMPLSHSQKLDAWGYAFSNDLLTPEQEVEYTEMLLKE